MKLYACIAGVISLLSLAVCVRDAAAQSVADFYHGKTISLLIGYTSGGGYDLNARVLSKHMGKHIPGTPSIVPQNMPGAGSLRLANFLYSVAPKDGLTIGMIGRGMAAEPLIGSSKTNYDSRQFTWLGSVSDQVSLCAAWYSSRVKTWQDMLNTDFALGGQGSGSDTDIHSMLLRNLFGVKVRLVSGYPGGNEINLAMERGEVDGRCGWSWSSIKITKPEWLQEKRINLLLQMALQKSSDLPDVPLIMDVANNDRQRQILKLVLSGQQMAWPFLAPPGLPADRVHALRDAFDATMEDREYRAEVTHLKLDINPMKGVEIAKLAAEFYETPPEVVAETKKAISEGAK